MVTLQLCLYYKIRSIIMKSLNDRLNRVLQIMKMWYTKQYNPIAQTKLL